MNELCTEEESLDVENSDVGKHNLFNRKKQSLWYFLKKKISISNVYTAVTLHSLDVSYTMIMWNELFSSHALISEILFLLDQFIQKQAGTL